MYKVERTPSDVYDYTTECDSLSDALARAKNLHNADIHSGLTAEVTITNEQNGLVVWNSNDAPELKAYEEYTHDQWNTIQHGHHEKSDKPSVYFDIDGTLGKWYADGRGLPLEEIMNPANHYFRDIEPHDMMVNLALSLQDSGYDVCIISAAGKDNIRDKWEWIEQNMPFVPKENICFAPIGADKSEFVKGNAEKSVLIDDYNKNLDEWKGTAFKAINTVNSHQDKYAELDFTRIEARMQSEKDLERDPDVDERVLEEFKDSTLNMGVGALKRAIERIDEKLDFIERYASNEENKKVVSEMNDKYPNVSIDEMREVLDNACYAMWADEAVNEAAVVKAYDDLMNTYEEYKQNWIAEHIDEETLTATEASYENNDEAVNMSFEEYVEEYGYDGGEIYACFDEFCQNDLPLILEAKGLEALADDIEQYMFERGEYDAQNLDKIPWVELGADGVSDNDRQESAENILTDLQNGDTAALIKYFASEIACLDKEDESLEKAEDIEFSLKSLAVIEAEKGEEELTVSPAASPTLAGYEWHDWSDGSGRLQNASGEKVAGYDLATREIQLDGKWEFEDGGLSEIKERAERFAESKLELKNDTKKKQNKQADRD